MIKNLAKVCTNVPKSPRAGVVRSPRTYVTEATEYAFSISRGTITGVDPGSAAEDPVCTKIFRETGHEAPALHPREIEVETSEACIIGRIWIGPLSIANDKHVMESF